MSMTKVPMNPPMRNVFIRCKPEEVSLPRITNATVGPQIKPLIEALSLKRPLWEFIVRGMGRDGPDNTREYSAFTVEQNGEELGVIDFCYNYSRGTYDYSINCRKLDRDRQRGSSTRTKDVKRAAKTVLDNFLAKSPAELLADAQNVVSPVLRNHTYLVAHKWSNTTTSLQTHVFDFVEARWDDFKAIPLPNAAREARDNYHEVKTKAFEATSLQQEYDNYGGARVRLMGDKFLVQWTQEEPKLYSAEELPDELLGRIGMLKLMEPKTVVPGIGVRGDEVSLFVTGVTPPKKEEEQ